MPTVPWTDWKWILFFWTEYEACLCPITISQLRFSAWSKWRNWTCMSQKVEKDVFRLHETNLIVLVLCKLVYKCSIQSLFIASCLDWVWLMTLSRSLSVGKIFSSLEVLLIYFAWHSDEFWTSHSYLLSKVYIHDLVISLNTGIFLLRLLYNVFCVLLIMIMFK